MPAEENELLEIWRYTFEDMKDSIYFSKSDEPNFMSKKHTVQKYLYRHEMFSRNIMNFWTLKAKHDSQNATINALKKQLIDTLNKLNKVSK